MSRPSPQPTIIGSGLTGLLISLALSKAKIKHVLIGGRPLVGAPRLGESLNLIATIHLKSEFPELAEFYSEKNFVRVIAGQRSGGFHFDIQSSPLMRFVCRHWNKQCPAGLIHVDRSRFDVALYDRAVSSPDCSVVEDRVTAVQVRPGTDTIVGLVLEQGSTLPVSHVFDATGHIRLLARLLTIQRRMLGPTQHVTYVHLDRNPEIDENGHFGPADKPEKIPDWRQGTTMVRLYRERHGFDGVAWCISVGDKVSVGVTTPKNRLRPGDDMLLEAAQVEFACHGVDYGACTQANPQPSNATMEFYTHARSFGSNWLLAGAAHSQIWWMSSIGLDLATAAAYAAVPFLDQPDAVGARYQSGLDHIEQLHRLWNHAGTHAYESLDPEYLSATEYELFWLTGQRLIDALSLEHTDWLSVLSTRATAVAKRSKASNFLAAKYGLKRIESSSSRSSPRFAEISEKLSVATENRN